MSPRTCSQSDLQCQRYHQVAAATVLTRTANGPQTMRHEIVSSATSTSLGVCGGIIADAVDVAFVPSALRLRAGRQPHSKAILILAGIANVAFFLLRGP
mmetsp:Transcript_43145/g.78460  ORF Transcript_43145/g.78460 Transcript_43145/m.78460 type:complete len:99 (-) Transcript_43145:62-358(-)